MAAIGTIINKTDFSIMSDFNLRGNWETVNSRLTSIGGNSVLQYKHASALDSFVLKVIFVSNSLTLKFQELRTTNNQNILLSIDNGKAKFQFTFNGFVSLGNSIIIEDGDVLEYVFTKNIWTLQFRVNNLTKGTFSETQGVGKNNANLPAHRFQLFSQNNAEIISIIKTSTEEFEPLNLVVGDSITYGGGASTPPLRWTSLSNFSALGSPGDRSVEALELFHEVFNIIKPKRVVYAMGTNDLIIDTWKTNLQLFKNKCESSNVVFIPITPYANNQRSYQLYSDYIKSNFLKYFDLFEATKEANSTNQKPEYVGDGVHPNDLGHQACATEVLNSAYYEFTPIVPQGDSALFASVKKMWFK